MKWKNGVRSVRPDGSDIFLQLHWMNLCVIPKYLCGFHVWAKRWRFSGAAFHFELQAMSKKKGRKSTLTPALRRQILALLAKAHTIKTVCAALGVGERSYFTWCEQEP